MSQTGDDHQSSGRPGSGGNGGVSRQALLHQALVVGETLQVMRVMRENQRWRSQDAAHSDVHWLMVSFQKLRWSLPNRDGLSADFDRMELIRPFVAAIRSEETSGPITGAALSSLGKFLSANVFHLGCLHAASAVTEIADSGTHCRFEATDVGHDELVLMRILEVHLLCLTVEKGSYLSDTSVWEMVQTCFRIHRQMRPPDYSQLLCDRAKQSLIHMIRIIFSHLASISQSYEIVNIHDVHVTNIASIEQKFGIACMVKVFGSLIAMGRLALQKVSPTRDRHVALIMRLILEAIESGGDLFSYDPSLLGLVQDDVCSFMLQNAQSSSNSVIGLILRIFFAMMTTLRDHIKVQVEIIMNTIFLRHEDVRFETQELILETFLDLIRLPWFVRELFVNYDCCLRVTNVFENLILYLCRAAKPDEDGSINSNQILAGWCLREVFSSIQGNDSEGGVSDADFDIEKLFATKRQKVVVQNCVVEFNKKAKAGIKAFADAGLIKFPADAAGMTAILGTTPGIDKKEIGELLGSTEPDHILIRDAFIGSFDFKGKTLVDALRICLEGFRLPGESQQIYRVLESISNHYFSQNPDGFVDADVLHVLTYALIMLNTDAHSGQIKNKMSLEQFSSSLRGVNGNDNFAPEFLSDLYTSIVNDPLKISREGPGGDVTKELWQAMIIKAHTEWGKDYVRYSGSLVDSAMFTLIWPPCVEAVSLLFSCANSQPMMESCFSCVDRVLSLACKHHCTKAVDELVSFAIESTGLLEILYQIEDAVAQIAFPSKTQLSVQIVMRQSVLEHMEESWGIWLSLLFRLLQFGLLPDSLAVLDDFIHEPTAMHRRRISFDDYIEKPVSIQSLFSSMQAFFAADEPSNDESTTDLTQIRDSARLFIQQLNVADLLSDTMYLSFESIDGLVKALITGQGVNVPQDNPASEVKKAVFYLQTLTNVIVRNRDRAQLFWPAVERHFMQLLLTASKALDENAPGSQTQTRQQFLDEAAVVSVIQLCIKLLALHSDELPILNLLQAVSDCGLLGHPVARIRQQIIAGLFRLVQTSSAYLCTIRAWMLIFEFLSKACDFPSTIAPGFETLSLMLSDRVTSVISIETIEHLIRILLLYAQTKSGASANRLRAIDYFVLLHDRLNGLRHVIDLPHRTICVHVNGDLVADQVESESLLLSVEEIRLSIMHALRTIICTSDKFSLREHSLVTLQQILLSPEAQSFGAETWRDIFEKVLLPMLKSLGESPSSRFLSKCRCTASSLTCRLFLTYLSVLVELETDFPRIWSSILLTLGYFIGLEDTTNSYSLLTETVRESIKNTLLVVQASGYFTNSDIFWESTWLSLAPHCPELRKEIFPDDESAQELLVSDVKDLSRESPIDSKRDVADDADRRTPPGGASIVSPLPSNGITASTDADDMNE